MGTYELHHTMNRQAELLAQAEREHWIAEYRKGTPNLAQRAILAVGGGLEAAGSWLKRQASPAGNINDMNRGLPVPR